MLLAIGLTLLALGAHDNVAPCEKAMIGHGPAGWRSESVAAGPVGMRRHPLDRMSRLGNGDLAAKAPILIEGREPKTVTVSVPPDLRGRVFLYYGRMRDRDGRPSSSFANTRGYDETEFQLCGDKPRTVWPGGLRVRGTRAVRLNVEVEGRKRPYLLHLGRPSIFQPRP